MARALGVFSLSEVEVEAKLDQVGNFSGIWVGGGGSRGQDGLDDDQGGGFFTLDRIILDPIISELTGEAPVQAGMSLGVREGSRVREAIQ